MYFTFTEVISVKIRLLIALSMCFFAIKAKSQSSSTIKAEAEIQATGTSGKTVPFWMRSNQFGSVPLSGASGSFIGKIYRPYTESGVIDSTSSNQKLFDWGFGLEGRANGGSKADFRLIEAYAKLRLGIVQLKGGRSRDVMGLNGDSTLSSGNFAVSGNALGIPKLEISIPEYYTIPVLKGLFSIKGNLAHGWLGKIQTDRNSYFHQKSAYLRIGTPQWRLKIYGGFNHQAYWGNEKDLYGSGFDLSTLQTFFYVFTGKVYRGNRVGYSKIGNQLGSIDLAAEYRFEGVKIMLYRQNFYDVGALSKLANIADGLNGISIENIKDNSNNTAFRWEKILFELFYSKDQAGYPWSIPTKSGDEDYYNNPYYRKGWSYYGMALGTPLITIRKDARKNQASREPDYFINNRVIAMHLGFRAKIDTWQFLTKLSYSWNYGTFGTSIYGNTTGNDSNPTTNNIFVPAQQFSAYLEGLKELKGNYKIGFSTALDRGELLNNSLAASLRLRKDF